MVEVIKRIDLCHSNASVIITPVQNDAGSRFLIASLTSEGDPYTIPEGCTVQLAVRKPDGAKTLTAASVKDNTVVCELTNQSLAVKGIADAQIIIYNGLAVLKTPPFKLNTFEQIVSDDTIVSTDEFTALSELMKNYQQVSEAADKRVKLINRVELSGDQTADLLSITQTADGKAFELSEMFFTANLVFDGSGGTASLRIRTDGGQRYMVLKSGIALTPGLVTCSGSCNAHGGTISTMACYTTKESAQDSNSINFTMISKTPKITYGIRNVEAFIYSTAMQKLKSGSFLEIWGC